MSTTDHPSIVACPHCGRNNRVRPAAAGAPHCGGCRKALPWLVDADRASFHVTVEQSSLPVLVDFWAPWCAPCRMVEPVVRELSRELAGRLKVVRVNCDEAPDVAERFEIRGVPTLVLFERGQVRDRLTGAANGTALRSWLEKHLASRRSA